jgi:hypothetical protein
LTLFHPASYVRFSAKHPTGGSPAILSTLALGLLLAAIENGLTLAPASFSLLISRQIIRFMSRALLAAGLHLAYPPSGQSAGEWSNLSNTGTDSALASPARPVPAGRSTGGARWNNRDTEKPADRGGERGAGWLGPGFSKKSAERGQSEKGRPFIGAPDTSTFKRMSTTGTREFHTHKLGNVPLNNVGVARGNAVPAPVERVIVRTVRLVPILLGG